MKPLFVSGKEYNRLMEAYTGMCEWESQARDEAHKLQEELCARNEMLVKLTETVEELRKEMCFLHNMLENNFNQNSGNGYQ